MRVFVRGFSGTKAVPQPFKIEPPLARFRCSQSVESRMDSRALILARSGIGADETVARMTAAHRADRGKTKVTEDGIGKMPFRKRTVRGCQVCLRVL